MANSIREIIIIDNSIATITALHEHTQYFNSCVRTRIMDNLETDTYDYYYREERMDPSKEFLAFRIPKEKAIAIYENPYQEMQSPFSTVPAPKKAKKKTKKRIKKKKAT